MRAKTNMLMPAMAVLTILGIISVGIVLEAQGHGAPWSAIVAARSQAIGARASLGEGEPAVTPASTVEEAGVDGSAASAASADHPPATASAGVADATLGSRGPTSTSKNSGLDVKRPVVSPKPSQPTQEPIETSPGPIETSPEPTVPTAGDQAPDSSTPSTVPAIVAVAAVDELPARSLLVREIGRDEDGGVPLVSAAAVPISPTPTLAAEIDTEMQHD